MKVQYKRACYCGLVQLEDGTYEMYDNQEEACRKYPHDLSHGILSVDCMKKHFKNMLSPSQIELICSKATVPTKCEDMVKTLENIK